MKVAEEAGGIQLGVKRFRSYQEPCVNTVLGHLTTTKESRLTLLLPGKYPSPSGNDKMAFLSIFE